MSGKQTTALIIIFIYMALTIVLGLVVSKRKAAKQAKQSNEDFLMAGKSLGPLVLAGTLFAANTGGASTTGIATNVYSYGISACWYVIAADEGAEIIYGHNAKSKEELAQMITAGDWEHLLTKIPVKAGDFFYVPSGTMHAIGKGILILETQQSSDTTYRVYDFDRKDASGKTRDLHLKQSIDVLTIGKPANSTPARVISGNLDLTTLVSNAFFTVYKWQISGQVDFKRTAPYLLLSVLEGQGQLVIEGTSYPIKKGNHFILPNDVNSWELTGELTLIVSHPNED